MQHFQPPVLKVIPAATLRTRGHTKERDVAVAAGTAVDADGIVDPESAGS